MNILQQQQSQQDRWSSNKSASSCNLLYFVGGKKILNYLQNTNTEQTSACYIYRNSGVLKTRGLKLWAKQSQNYDSSFACCIQGVILITAKKFVRTPPLGVFILLFF